MSNSSPTEARGEQPQTTFRSISFGEQDWLLTGFLAFFLLFCAIVLGFILVAA